MSKLSRLKKIHKLVKLQEQELLAEFKNIQNINSSLKIQINDLSEHSKLSSNKLMEKTVNMHELSLVRSFNGNIELVLEQLNFKLSENNKKFLHVADKVKEVRSRIKSIERLEGRHQLQQDNELQKNIQQQIEENINYTLSSQK